MSNRIVITEYKNKTIVVFIKNDSVIKMRALGSADEMTGTIYLGRIQSVKGNIDSCFVKYNEKSGFLKGKNRKPETVLPIMLKKETSSNKMDEVTDKLSIAGIFSVVTSVDTGMSFSSRFDNDEKKEFETLGLSNAIIRLNAKNTDINTVKTEYEYLNSILNKVNDIKDKRVDNSILYSGIPALINVVFSENYREYEEILTDSNEVYNLINQFYKEYENNNIKIDFPVRLYEDDLVSLPAFISLSSKVDRALCKTIYLKSDANLTFDYTEAMTVIDVNSGTTTFKGDKAEVIHKINIEAAKEIALQLKLRNISGIIIVDFMKEYKKSYNEELIEILRQELKNDDQHAKCYGMTKLGLVEITRNRTNKFLYEQLK